MENYKPNAILCTVSDDRFGRKDGLYKKTQEDIFKIFSRNPQFGIHDFIMNTWDDIIKTSFYQSNKALLDNTDAARNGRAYKPYTIRQALNKINEGDFVIYTDCSPEMWQVHSDFYLGPEYNLEIIKNLCSQNNGILTAFVKWDTRNILKNQYGIHTHENFTTNRCMEKMELKNFSKSFMHANGMTIIQKLPHTIQFVDEWLYWNCVDECACLGKINIPNDYSYWDEEANLKIGHRQDQSISGLLINKMNNNLIDIVHDTGLNTYNFLNFCLPNYKYEFINSNITVPDEKRLKKGDRVVNEQGEELSIYEFQPDKGIEWIIVGPHRESCYRTTEDKLTKIN